jgi:hypothetical protein
MDCTGSFGVVYTGASWTVTGLYLAAVLHFYWNIPGFGIELL